MPAGATVNAVGLENRKCFSLDCHDAALVVKFSPYDWSTNLLAIGTYTQILVVSCRVQEEKGTLEGVEFERLTEFHHSSRVTDVSWCPETNLHNVPSILKFFSAGADRVVRCFTSDIKTSNNVTIVGEHTDYINAIASHPETGDQVASVSDDLTCCVWSLAGDTPTCMAVFPLTSPGMAVCWHPNEPSKILVAEKKGLIRFYSVVSQQAFMSLDCTRAPLISADWCRSNALRVAALADTDWFVFDTSRSSMPLDSHQAHSGGGRSIHWCHSHEYLLAMTGRPGAQLKVFNMRSNQVVLTVDMKVASGLCWHSRVPVLAIGVDNQVHLWMVETF